MALVDHQEEVLGEEVEQAVGTRPGGTAVEVAGVVLDAGTVAQFADHLEVVGDALVQALGFEEAAFALEELDLAVEVVLDLVDGAEGVLLGGHEEVGGVDAVVVEAAEGDTRYGVHLLDAVHLVAPEGDAQEVVVVGQEDVHCVALDAEVASVQFQVVAHVEAVHQAAEEDVAAESLAAGDVDGVVVEVGRVAHAVDAGHGGDHHHILASAEQGRGGCQAELVDLTVDGQVLLDVGIRRRDVGLGLVVVVVGHVVLHGVLREEALELAVELGGQRLVVAQDERGLVDVGDDVGDGEGLSRAGDTEQRLGRQALADTVGELADSFGLVARRLVVGGELELVHNNNLFRIHTIRGKIRDFIQVMQAFRPFHGMSVSCICIVCFLSSGFIRSVGRLHAVCSHKILPFLLLHLLFCSTLLYSTLLCLKLHAFFLKMYTSCHHIIGFLCTFVFYTYLSVHLSFPCRCPIFMFFRAINFVISII